MIERQRTFYSDGLRLEGAFYLPEGDGDDARPLVVPCSGFTGYRRIHPERFARALTARGYRCFAFDYRGHGPSEGVQHRVLLEEQVRDIRHAAAFAGSDDLAGGRDVVLLGWGMGGGMVLDAARGLADLCGIVCVNGFYDALRVQRAVRGDQQWSEFSAWLQRERRAATRSPEPRYADPFWIYPLDDASRVYVDSVLRRVEGYEWREVQTVMADSLLSFAPLYHLDHLRGVPALIAHGDRNVLHPVEQARSLYERYPGSKELYWIEGGGHTEWMADDNPLFRALASRIADWLDGLQAAA